MNTDVVTKWSKTGLLDGNEGFAASVLADSLENCTTFLFGKVEENGKDGIENFFGIILPIVVRLANERNIWTVDFDRLYNEVSLSFGGKFFTPDEETEACHRFVEAWRE